MLKPMRTRSIRTRLTAWYALSTLLILTVTGTISYFAIRAIFVYDTDRSLTIKGMEVIYSAAGSELLHRSNYYLEPPIDRRTLLANMSRQFDTDAYDPLGDAIYMRLFRTSPDALALISHNVKKHDLIQRTLGQTLNIDKAQNVSGSFLGANEFDELRVLNIRVPRQPYILQLATSWQHYEDTLRTTVLVIASIIGFGFALSALGGWLLVGRTLQPILEIVIEASKMSGDKLEPAFVAARTVAEDEIGQLVKALNAMMGRVHQAIVSQRRFTADASHDLKTPLAILLGEMELALTRERSGEEYRRVLVSGLEETKRLIHIVGDLRDLATAEFEKEHRMNRTLVDIVRLTQSVVGNRQRQAQLQNIDLTMSNTDNVPEILIAVDESALERAIANLVDNAILYNTQPGRVDVSIDVSDGVVLIHVRDTGIGIPVDECDLIFDRFYRGDRSRTTVSGLNSGSNSGLGLAIVKSVVTAHGGRVTVRSELGVGSVFTIRLPK
jgi:two-component system OmpR family sensor kinase